LGDRLALFQCHRNRHRFDALAHELHGLEDDLGSLGRRGARPRFEAPLSGSQRIIQIGTAGPSSRIRGFFGSAPVADQ
jgi:hypothetical protein